MGCEVHVAAQHYLSGGLGLKGADSTTRWTPTQLDLHLKPLTQSRMEEALHVCAGTTRAYTCVPALSTQLDEHFSLNAG